LKKIILLFFCILAAARVFAISNTDTTHTSLNTLGSKFYFPNSIGLSVPFRSSHTSLRGGFAINAGVEFRPKYMNAFFYRLDLDILSNNYTSYVHNLPTNIIQGKLSSDFILTGVGYRKKLNRWAIYAEELPGLGMRSYDKATINTNGVIINRATNDSFASKSSVGLEYYIKKHFDAFFEPSYYKFFSRQGFNSSRSQLMGFTMGIATARF
jgi:hypothetical protein